MSDQATPTPPPTAAEDDSTSASRNVRRRRSLPGGRAVVGAFLVTLAAVGIFSAHLRSNAVPTTTYAAATRDLLPGDVLTADDWRMVAIDLPEAQAAMTVNRDGALQDRVVLSPMKAGELFGTGDTGDPAQVEGTSSITFPIATNRALNGDLQSGDRVDVIATLEDVTGYVASDLAVVSATTDGTATTITVAIPDPTTLLVVANAIDTADVFVARHNPTANLEGIGGARVITDTDSNDTSDDTGNTGNTDDATNQDGQQASDDGAADGAESDDQQGQDGDSNGTSDDQGDGRGDGS